MEYLTPKQAARRLGVSVAYLYARVEAGELPASNLGNRTKRRLRFSTDALDDFMRARELRPTKRPQKRANGVTVSRSIMGLN